jgi:RHS repeat-associated protein
MHFCGVGGWTQSRAIALIAVLLALTLGTPLPANAQFCYEPVSAPETDKTKSKDAKPKQKRDASALGANCYEPPPEDPYDPPPPTHAAAYLGQSVPTSMVGGGYYTATVQMRNDGANTWRRSEGYRLGSQNPGDNVTWGLHRVELPHDVAPGGAVTFQFTVRAPNSGGTYNFQWRMVQDGVTWFGAATANLGISVATSRITGHIDGVGTINGMPHVQGWACSTGLNQSIDVHMYLGGAAGSSPYGFAYTANVASEPAVASACQAGGTNYRFNIPLTDALREQHGGKLIYIHGISPTGQPNDLISRSGVYVVPTIAPARAAAYVAQTLPTTMVAGQSYAVAVQMRNDGRYTWRAADGYTLGSQNAPNNTTWGPNRATLLGDVTTGSIANFNFTAKAPSTAGTYNFQWQMLQEGVTWFGPLTPNQSVRVVSGSISGTPSPCSIPYGGSTCSATISWSSTAPDAEVWVTDANNGNAQLFARAQSASQTANVGASVSRFHLRAGGVTMATVDVRGNATVNAVPTVTLTAPTAGNAGLAPASIAVSASASDADDGIASVTFYANGSPINTDSAAPYAFTWSNVSAGTYNVHAIARDTRGATATSAVVSINVVQRAGTLASSTRHYIYDQHQRLCKVVEPETRATVMDYDPAGNLAWSASGLELMGTAVGQCDRTDTSVATRKVSRTYDARNRVQHLRFPDGRGDQDWTYTPTGQPKTITTSNDGPGQTLLVNTYDYNRRGLLTGESSGQPNWYSWGIGYGYNRNGHQQGVRYPTGLYVDFGTNALGQPKLVQSDLGVYASGIQYHPNGSIKQFTYGNGVVHSMQQNARQLPARVSSLGGPNTPLDYAYSYDVNGNVSDIYDHALGSAYNRHMRYDGLDRLTAAGSWMFGGDAWNYFTYDKLDNLTSWKLAGVKDYAEYYYEPGTHRLMSLRNSMGSTVAGFDYDPQGNLSNKNGQLHKFDYGNRLRTAPAGETYRYDGHGRRVLARSPQGDLFSYYAQSGQLLYQSDERKPGIDLQEHIYIAGSLIATRHRNYTTGATEVKYQHTDALGSPVAVTNASGAVIERTQYEPYGAIVGGAKKQGIGYTGHVMDAATGLTYMQQRYYDPQVGRFLSVDPVTALDNGDMRHLNRYAYAYNNPYRFTDPDGRWASQKGAYVHQRATYLVIGKNLPLREHRIIAQAHVAADAKEYQGPDSSFRHAMRNGDQSVEEARGAANQFVRSQFEKAWNAPTRDQALHEFGVALHTLQDSTSPSHAGFQEWTGEESVFEIGAHIGSEVINPGSGSELFNITEDAWNWFNERQLPEGDLFQRGSD